MLARLIARVMIEIGIETIYNEGLTAIWPTPMPFSPAPREFRSKFASESVEKRGKKVGALFSTTLISYSLEYMLRMCL